MPEKALQIDDRLGEVRLNLAILYSRQGNMVAAVNHLKTFISYYPDVAGVLLPVADTERTGPNDRCHSDDQEGFVS